MENRLIDIIMPTYNSSKYLSEQLDSIFNQTYKNFKLLIADDASQDDTVSIIKNYAKKYPEKLEFYEHKKNLGIKENIAFLLSKTKAQYIMFSDHDDFWLSNKIEITVEEARKLEVDKENDAILIFTDKIVTDENLLQIAKSHSKQEHFDTKHLDLKHLLKKNVASGCTMLINRNLLNFMLINGNISIPQEAIMHDYWVILLASAFGKIKYINKQTLLYRQHSNNSIGVHKRRIPVLFKMLIKKELFSFIKNRLETKTNQATKFYEIYEKKINENRKAHFFKPYLKLKNNKSIEDKNIISYLKLIFYIYFF